MTPPLVVTILHLACNCSIRTVVEPSLGGRFYCLEHGSQNVVSTTTEQHEIGRSEPK